MKLVCLMLGIILFQHTSLFAQDKNIVPGNILLVVASDSDAELVQRDFLFIKGVETKFKMERTVSKSMHIFLFSFDETAIKGDVLLQLLKMHPLVKIAQFNHTFKGRAIPNDSQFGLMWDMNNTGQSGGVIDADIDAVEAWDVTTGGLTADGDTIVVAVIDAGFSLTHPDLNYWKNYDEIANNGLDDDNNGYIDDYDGWNPSDDSDNWFADGHGTHVSGTVGAIGNNALGVTGVNWNVQIMPITFGSGGNLEADVIEAYGYARDQRKAYNTTNGVQGAFVVSTNSSFGVDLAMPEDYPLWCAMYDSLGAVGILSAGATANANFNIDTQGDIPTACTSDWLISVTNTTRYDTRYSSSGYGALSIDLGAPGSGITSTYVSSGTDGYVGISGTSMATPHVAGAVALMLSVPCPQFISDYKADPAAMSLYIKTKILQGVDVIPALSNGITVSGGRLNLFNAVSAIQAYCSAAGQEQLASPVGPTIYPNPFTNDINITGMDLTGYTISVYDVQGQLCLQKAIKENIKSIELSDQMKAGFYFMVISKEDFSFHIKIIKQ